jgi:hypothetical protein
MRESGVRGAIGAERISQIIATRRSDETIHPNAAPVPICIAGALDSDPSPENRPENMHALALRSDEREFLGAFRASPAGEKLAESVALHDIAERERIVAEIELLDAESTADYPKHEKLVAAAIAAHRAAEVALRAASDKVVAAANARSASATYSSKRERLEKQLRDGADAEPIDAFVRDMRDEIDATMKRHEGGWRSERHPVSREGLRIPFTNWPSVAARIAAIKAAVGDAERIRLSPDQRQVRKRLAELRAGLPETGPPETGEPVHRPTIDPRPYAPGGKE